MDDDDDKHNGEVRIIGCHAIGNIGNVPAWVALSADENDDDDEDTSDDDEEPEPITSLDELAERIKIIREIIPGAMFSFIEPCDLCGLNKWDQATHDVHGNCRYLAYRSVAGDMHLARIEYEHWCTITYKESAE